MSIVVDPLGPFVFPYPGPPQNLPPLFVRQGLQPRTLEEICEGMGLVVVSRNQWDNVGPQRARWAPLANARHLLNNRYSPEWAGWSLPIIRPKAKVKLICVHHTLRDADVYGYVDDHKIWHPPLSAREVLRNIVRLQTTVGMFKDTMGERKGFAWSDIAYNVLIDRDGIVYSGRWGGPYVQGAGAWGTNGTAVHVALLGNYDKHKPTKRQTQALKKLLTALCREFEIDPLARHIAQYIPVDPTVKEGPEVPMGRIVPTIVGHSDVYIQGRTRPDSASCPGRYVYRLLRQIRKDVSVALKHKVLTVEQVNCLLAALDGRRMEPLFRTLLTLGIRPSEALRLEWNSVDLEHGRVRIEAPPLQRHDGQWVVKRTPKNSATKNTLGLPGVLVETLRTHGDVQNNERKTAGRMWQERGLVFTQPSGRPISHDEANGILAEICAQANVPKLTMHELRYSTPSMHSALQNSESKFVTSASDGALSLE